MSGVGEEREGRGGDVTEYMQSVAAVCSGMDRSAIKANVGTTDDRYIHIGCPKKRRKFKF